MMTLSVYMAEWLRPKTNDLSSRIVGLKPLAIQLHIHTYVLPDVLADKVGIVGCAIHCIMHVHSLQGDKIATGFI